MIILGIDPGYGRMGYGLVEKKGNELVYLSHGLIETSKTCSFHERLIQMHQELHSVIEKYHPSRAAIEELFFAKNAKTAMNVGVARGVILLTLLEADLQVDEYTPLEVKQAVTGYGRADKTQVARMLLTLLHLPKKPIQDDAADALAVALTAGLLLRVH